MTVDDDPDLKQWTADWQSAPSDVESAEQIHDYVKRHTGLWLSFAIADMVIGGVALPVLGYLAAISRNDVERMAMLGLASITVGAVTFGWWNRRGVLRASATTTAEYVAISVERIRRMAIAVSVGWLVLISEVIVFTIWIWARLYSGTRTVSPGEEQLAWSWLAGFTILAMLALARFGRWLRRDAARFDALRREFDTDSPSAMEGSARRSHRSVNKRRRQDAN